MLQCGITCGGVALNVTVHLLLGGVCWSPATSAVVHADLATSRFPVVRLAVGSQLVVNGLLTAASAAHFARLSSEGAVRTAKLITLSVLALVSILGHGLGWMDDFTAFTRMALMLGSAVLSLLGCVFIYWETQSRAMFHFLCTVPGIALAFAVLSVAFPLDLNLKVGSYTAQNQITTTRTCTGP